MTTATSETEPHVMVTWSNAISPHGRTSECFETPDLARAAMADQTRHQWNNTRVTICWHEPHELAAERKAMREAHAGTRHVWGLPCPECGAIEARRRQAAALTAEARDAAGDQDLAVVTS